MKPQKIMYFNSEYYLHNHNYANLDNNLTKIMTYFGRGSRYVRER